MKWYLVSDKTPEPNKPIIVTDLYGGYSVGEYNNGKYYNNGGYDIWPNYCFDDENDCIEAWAYIDEPNFYQ